MSEAGPRKHRQERWHVTRETFLETARNLFRHQGFEATTMAQIAEQSGKHIQTLYRHFPTKNALHAHLYLKEFEDALASRQTDALVFWQDWIRKSARLARGAAAAHARRAPLEIPGVAWGESAPLEVADQYIDSLAAALADDFNLDPDASRLPILIANMLWGANRDAIRRYYASRGKNDYVQLKVDAAEEASLAALKLLGIEARQLTGERRR
jgi:AcrR family transcriptional regulator